MEFTVSIPKEEEAKVQEAFEHFFGKCEIKEKVAEIINDTYQRYERVKASEAEMPIINVKCDLPK